MPELYLKASVCHCQQQSSATFVLCACEQSYLEGKDIRVESPPSPRFETGDQMLLL